MFLRFRQEEADEEVEENVEEEKVKGKEEGEEVVWPAFCLAPIIQR